jgi:hypothetical protein
LKELNLGVSIEDVEELTASYSELKVNENLIYIEEEKKTPPEVQDDDCQSSPTKTLNVKETFDHLEQFLSMMEEYDTNTERFASM